MMNTKGNMFTLTTDDGKTLECEVIMTIDSKEFSKNYMVYTDHTIDENGYIKTYASSYDPTGEDINLKPVETKEEWDMIENILSSAQKQVLNEEKESRESSEGKN